MTLFFPERMDLTFARKKNLRIAMIRVMARVSFGSKYSSNGIKHTHKQKKKMVVSSF